MTAEIARQLLDCSAKAIITLTDLWPLAKATKEIMKKDIPIITVKSQVIFLFFLVIFNNCHNYSIIMSYNFKWFFFHVISHKIFNDNTKIVLVNIDFSVKMCTTSKK